MGDIITLVLGLTIWHFFYGVEVALNGGTFLYPYPIWTAPFYHWWFEMLQQLPFVGKRFRLEWTCGDEEKAQRLYMPFHFVCMCILLPLGPWLLYRILT